MPETPLPSPRWGRWRYETIESAGCKIVPAAVSEFDRKTVRDRTEAQSRQEDSDNEDRPISE